MTGEAVGSPYVYVQPLPFEMMLDIHIWVFWSKEEIFCNRKKENWKRSDESW